MMIILTTRQAVSECMDSVIGGMQFVTDLKIIQRHVAHKLDCYLQCKVNLMEILNK